MLSQLFIKIFILPLALLSLSYLLFFFLFCMDETEVLF